MTKIYRCCDAPGQSWAISPILLRGTHWVLRIPELYGRDAGIANHTHKVHLWMNIVVFLGAQKSARTEGAEAW